MAIQKGNRKTPGFNPDPRVVDIVRRWFDEQVRKYNPDSIIITELSLLGIFEPNWKIAMIDSLRGGIYPYKKADGSVIPVMITVPISAINTQKKTKDIRAMNRGSESKSEWEEQRAYEAQLNGIGDSESEDGSGEEDEIEELFFEPYTIPYGRWVLAADLRKFFRVTGRGYRYSSPQVRIVLDKFEAKEAFEFLMESKMLSSDIETIPDLALMNVNGYTGVLDSMERRTYVFPWYNDFSPQSGIPADFSYMYEYQRRLNASGIPFTLHNGPYDLYYYTMYHMPVANYAYDSMTMFWSLFPELPKRLDFVSSIMLDDYVYWKGDRKTDSWFKFLEYNGKDCDRTALNTIRMIQSLTNKPRALRNFVRAHNRVVIALGMSLRGMNMDMNRLAEHGVDLEKDAAEALARLQYIVGDSEFNPKSPKQKARLLYDVLGVRLRNARGRYVTKREDASTGAIVLRSIKHEHPIYRRVADGITKASEPAKQISNVVRIKRAPWLRLYTGYAGVGTTTERLSSSEPPTKYGTNLQNIRAKYRDFIVADPGCYLLDMDLSAGDDVFVTYESADPRKIELHRSGLDSHAKNATLFFPDWEYSEVVRLKKLNDDRVVHPITGIRQITKKLAHGCNYLMAAMTLYVTAGREAIVAAAMESGHANAGLWEQERLVEFCLELEHKYRAYYTRFAREGEHSWYTDLKREFWSTGGFLTPFHYFQRFLGDAHDDSVHRALAATAGQAGTAGRINMALEELVLGNICPTFRDAENPARFETPLKISEHSHGISLRLQTHDSLTWNIDPEHPNVDEGLEMIQTVMRRPVVIKNKLTGDMETFVVGTESGVGPAWGKHMVEVKTVTRDSVRDALLGMPNSGLYIPTSGKPTPLSLLNDA